MLKCLTYKEIFYLFPHKKNLQEKKVPKVDGEKSVSAGEDKKLQNCIRANKREKKFLV